MLTAAAIAPSEPLVCPPHVPHSVCRTLDPDLIRRDYNIAYSRRRFLKPMLTDTELREMAELEKLCFPSPDNYDLRTLKMFVSRNGAGLLRLREIVDEKPVLIAFHLFDCLQSELITIDVHPGFRRSRIASELYRESLAKLKDLGHRHVTCQVATDNEPSLRFHRQFGFRPIEKLPNYYGPGRSAFLLRARLV